MGAFATKFCDPLRDGQKRDVNAALGKQVFDVTQALGYGTGADVGKPSGRLQELDDFMVTVPRSGLIKVAAQTPLIWPFGDKPPQIISRPVERELAAHSGGGRPKPVAARAELCRGRSQTGRPVCQRGEEEADLWAMMRSAGSMTAHTATSFHALPAKTEFADNASQKPAQQDAKGVPDCDKRNAILYAGQRVYPPADSARTSASDKTSKPRIGGGCAAQEPHVGKECGKTECNNQEWAKKRRLS